MGNYLKMSHKNRVLALLKDGKLIGIASRAVNGSATVSEEDSHSAAARLHLRRGPGSRAARRSPGYVPTVSASGTTRSRGLGCGSGRWRLTRPVADGCRWLPRHV